MTAWMVKIRFDGAIGYISHNEISKICNLFIFIQTGFETLFKVGSRNTDDTVFS